MYMFPLTTDHYVYRYIYVNEGQAMNRVPFSRRVQIINCLVEGNSIRSTERMTNTHRDTICRLLVEVGEGCAALMDEQMRELPCRRIEVDEIWAYVGKKQRHMTPLDDPRPVRRSIHLRCARSRDEDRPGISRRQARSANSHGIHNRPFRATGKPGAAIVGRTRGLRRSD
jgi:hypothetical protein